MQGRKMSPSSVMLFLRFTEFYAQTQETGNIKCKNHAGALFLGGGGRGNPTFVTAENYTQQVRVQCGTCCVHSPPPPLFFFPMRLHRLIFVDCPRLSGPFLQGVPYCIMVALFCRSRERKEAGVWSCLWEAKIFSLPEWAEEWNFHAFITE